MKSSFFVKRLREKKLLLPPLTGYTDYPYRSILAGFDPPFLTTEMINARALLHQNLRTVQMVKRVPGMLVQGVQLLGKDPESMAQAARIIEGLGFDYIDINMGCTIKRITARGEGVALMNDEGRACAAVEAVSHAVDLPVTVKLRCGSSKKSVNVTVLSKKLVDAGAVALTVHGRTGEKKFESSVDLSSIRDVVQGVSVPVVANGGVFSGDDAQDVLEVTGAAAVMPGRGLIGNPWLVSEICCAFSGKRFYSPSLQERKEVCLKHALSLCEYYGERKGVIRMRSILPKYFPAVLWLKDLKEDINCVSTSSDLRLMLERITERGSKWCYAKE